MPNELFPFKFYDPIRKRWIPARYRATREEIASRYEKWEITGPGVDFLRPLTAIRARQKTLASPPPRQRRDRRGRAPRRRSRP